MTEQSLLENYQISEIGPVEDQLCISSNNELGQLGLIDELVKNAQQKSGADFIGDAKIYQEANDCINIAGIGYKKSLIKSK